MLLSQSSTKKYSIFLILATILFSYEIEAKRYINAKDSEVSYTLNEGSADHYAIEKSKIKVLVWNLYKGEKDSFAKDYKALSAGKDIILLQEVTTHSRMKKVIQADTTRTYHMATSFFDTDENWTRSGTATASKYKVSEASWQRSRYVEPFVKTPKMISIAKFDIAGSSEQLMTLSIHGVNFVSAKKLKDQISQAAALISTHKGPVIFGGDFNTWSDKKLEAMNSTLTKVGLVAVPFGSGRMETFGKPLDHVFIKGVTLNSSKVHKNIEGSDHRALEIDVTLPN